MPAALRFVFIALGACAYGWIELTTSLHEEMRGKENISTPFFLSGGPSMLSPLSPRSAMSRPTQFPARQYI
jgi:hypothetical protein